MNTAVNTSLGMSSDVEREARAWMNDPYSHYGNSNTRMHSLSWQAAEPIQLAALNLRPGEEDFTPGADDVLGDGWGRQVNLPAQETEGAERQHEDESEPAP